MVNPTSDRNRQRERYLAYVRDGTAQTLRVHDRLESTVLETATGTDSPKFGVSATVSVLVTAVVILT